MNPRPCTFGQWDATKKEIVQVAGKWLAWSVDYEELREGVGLHPVALCEDSSGQVHIIRTEWVRFTDTERGGV